MLDYLLVVAPISVDVTNDVVALCRNGESTKKYRNFNVEKYLMVVPRRISWNRRAVLGIMSMPKTLTKVRFDSDRYHIQHTNLREMRKTV